MGNMGADLFKGIALILACFMAVFCLGIVGRLFVRVTEYFGIDLALAVNVAMLALLCVLGFFWLRWSDKRKS